MIYVLACSDRCHIVTSARRYYFGVNPLRSVSCMLANLFEVYRRTSRSIHWIVQLCPSNERWRSLEVSCSYSGSLRGLVGLSSCLYCRTIAWMSGGFWRGSITAVRFLMRRRANRRVWDSIKTHMFCTVDHWKALLILLISLAGNESLYWWSSCCGWLVGSLRGLITTSYFEAALKMFTILHNGGSWILWLLRDTPTHSSHWWRKRCHLMISHIRRYLLCCLIGEIKRSLRICIMVTLSILIVHRAIKHGSRLRCKQNQLAMLTWSYGLLMPIVYVYATIRYLRMTIIMCSLLNLLLVRTLWGPWVR
jgi:hypothetical protein